MFWYTVFGLAVVAIFAAIALSASRWWNPYARENQPGEAPPRGTPGRRWWRRKASQGPGPGSPL